MEKQKRILLLLHLPLLLPRLILCKFHMEKHKRILLLLLVLLSRLIVCKFNMEKHKRIESETTKCPSTTPRLIVCKFNMEKHKQEEIKNSLFGQFSDSSYKNVGFNCTPEFAILNKPVLRRYGGFAGGFGGTKPPPFQH